MSRVRKVVVSRARKLPPVSPGEMLMEEFLKPMGISKYRLAKEIGVPAQRIGEIVAGRRAITADTDLRPFRRLVAPRAASLRPGAHAGRDGEGLGQDSALVRSEFSTRVSCGTVSLLRQCVKFSDRTLSRH